MKMEFDLTAELPPGIYEVELDRYTTREWVNPDSSETSHYLDFVFSPVNTSLQETIQYSCLQHERGARSKLARLVKSLLPGRLGKIQLNDLLQRRMKAEVDLNDRGYLVIKRHWPLESLEEFPEGKGTLSPDHSSSNEASS